MKFFSSSSTSEVSGRPGEGPDRPRFRKVDRQHVLVQQLKKRDDVLAVVKERILTTSSCSVTMIKKDQCNIRGVLRLMGMLENSVKVRARHTVVKSSITQKVIIK